MGVAALILGILSLIVAVIPFCGIVALLPCLIGLGLGIGDIIVKHKHGQSKGMGIAGTVLNALALVFILIWTLLVAAQAAAVANDPNLQEAIQIEIQKAQEEEIIETKDPDNRKFDRD